MKITKEAVDADPEGSFPELPKEGPAPAGHNNPPEDQPEQAKTTDALILAELKAIEDELNAWQDGTEVQDRAQMEHVEDLISMVKRIEKKAKNERETEYRPVKSKLDEIGGRWKIVLDSIAFHRTGLLAVITKYKEKLQAEQRAEQQRLYRIAEEKRLEAAKAQAEVDMKNAEQRREADRLALEARQAQQGAQQVRKETVTHMRTVRTVTLTDTREFARWYWTRHPQEMAEFLNHEAQRLDRLGNQNMPGVSVKTEKKAY